MNDCCIDNSEWDLMASTKVYECQLCGCKSYKRLDHLDDDIYKVESVNMNENATKSKL